MALLRSRSYIQILVLAALIGVPVSAVAYFFLKLVALLQNWFFTTLPKEIGFSGTPVWWPLPLLAVAGVLVAATITVPAGHRPVTSRPRGSRPVGPPPPPSSPASSWPRWPPSASASSSVPRRR